MSPLQTAILTVLRLYSLSTMDDVFQRIEALQAYAVTGTDITIELCSLRLAGHVEREGRRMGHSLWRLAAEVGARN